MISPEMYKSWILPIQVMSVEPGVLTLGVPTPFFMVFFKGQLEAKIIHALALTTGETYKIQYSVGEEEPKANVSSLSDAAAPAKEASPLFSHPIGSAPKAPSHQPSVTFKGGRGLTKLSVGVADSSHSFESFIVCSGTQFAHAAARGVAMNPGSKYNPLFIYGPSGLGKTHLLHAIALQTLKTNPEARICYISAESFVNEFIEAIKNKATDQFHNKYRSGYDVFLIDDVQYIGGKEKSEEEFFHTFNYLFTTHSQVVLTSDKAPKELHNLEDRLVTRLQQGLVIDVKPPDLETRIAILKAKAEADDLYVPDDVCLMIASHIRNNVRELEGALVRLGAEASLNGTEISLDMAKEALSGLLNDNRTNTFSIEMINKCVCQYFKINMSELNSKSRARKYSEPRQIAMYLSRKYTGKTFPEIAQAYGGKDHSTVIHAIRKIERDMTSSLSLKKQIEDIQQML